MTITKYRQRNPPALVQPIIKAGDVHPQQNFGRLYLRLDLRLPRLSAVRSKRRIEGS